MDVVVKETYKRDIFGPMLEGQLEPLMRVCLLQHNNVVKKRKMAKANFGIPEDKVLYSMDGSRPLSIWVLYCSAGRRPIKKTFWCSHGGLEQEEVQVFKKSTFSLSFLFLLTSSFQGKPTAFFQAGDLKMYFF